MRETPRQRHLRVKYGLTEETYKRLYDAGRGLCWICEIKPKSSLQVDHDHKTGEIRGLLCWRCNKGLDYHWTLWRVRAAYAYLCGFNNGMGYTGYFVPPKKKKKRRKR